MRRAVLVLATLLLPACWIVAQQPPPAATGIGNSGMATQNDTLNNPSMSPDQNQAATGTRGSVEGDKANPAFAGSSGMSTSGRARSNGTEGAAASVSATGGRRGAHTGAAKQKGNAAEAGRKGTAAQRKKAAQQRRSAKKQPSSGGQKEVTTQLPPTQGASTTESPGPSTGNSPKPKP